MPPTIHIVCEAEPESGPRLRDPSITDLGFLQSRRIRDTFPYMNQVRAIFSTPLRRTVQTARYAFQPLLNQGLQITLQRSLLGWQGTPENTGSPWEELREEFGLDIDVRDLQDGWWYQIVNDIRNFSPDLAYEQARQARLHIREVARRLGNNDHIVVVLHNLFIGYLTGNIGEDLANGEYRSYQFTDLFNEDDDIAHLERVDTQNGSSRSSSSSHWSQTTSVTDPIEISSDSSYSDSQTSLTEGGPTNPIEIFSDSSSNSSQTPLPEGGPMSPIEVSSDSSHSSPVTTELIICRFDRH